MRFGDLVKHGSHEDVVKHLRELASRIDAARAGVSIRKKDDYLGFALGRLVVYASTQVNRLAALYHGEVEPLGWIARNLFEASLICDYVLTDLRRAQEFCTQKARDEIQINEGFITLSEDPKSPDLAPLRDRIGHIRRTLSAHAMPESRPWSVSDLAKWTNRTSDYDAFFKLYSKYVHPSSWLVLAEPTEIDNEATRYVFVLQAQYYAAQILKIAEDYPSLNKGPAKFGA